jgi:hypothetical protein
MIRVLILLLVCFASVPTRGDGAAVGSVDEDVRALSAVKVFAFDVVMLVGRSEGEVLLARILRREDKIRPLMEVYNRGSNEAKIYALAAFHHLAPQLFAQCKKDLVGKYNPVVRSAAGCFSLEGNLLEYVIRIHHGEYDYYIRKYSEAEPSQPSGMRK